MVVNSLTNLNFQDFEILNLEGEKERNGLSYKDVHLGVVSKIIYIIGNMISPRKATGSFHRVQAGTNSILSTLIYPQAFYL